MKKYIVSLGLLLGLTSSSFAQIEKQVKVENGLLEGVKNPTTNITIFKGIPYAAPPVGELRWKDPQPANSWSGIRKADKFGNNAMQKNVFGDMNFRSSGMSEDCLYLNVWTPAKKGTEKLPVLVYYFGGGLVAGDGSEPRYDGESLAQKDIVVVTINYRLGVFGFFSLPELSAESPHHSSGNYGYLDQLAALKWVKQNIAAFGGNPDHVTIGGESAGSISVSVQMASPISKNYFQQAMGESGAAIEPTLFPIPLQQAEEKGIAFENKMKVKSLAELRAIPASQLLDSAFNVSQGPIVTTIDGYIIPKTLPESFDQKQQNDVPLLVGWNSAEVPYQFLMGPTPLTKESYVTKINSIYGDQADKVLQLYPANNEDELIHSATALASDRFIVYSTWKWSDLAIQNGTKSVYRYLFSRMRPPFADASKNLVAGLAGGVSKAKSNTPKIKVIGATHASEIEYALGNLYSNKVYGWTPEDYAVSKTMETYFANFIKTGNPNGKYLPTWKPLLKNQPAQYINIDVKSKLETENNIDRYDFLNTEYSK